MIKAYKHDASASPASSNDDCRNMHLWIYGWLVFDFLH